MRTVIRRLLLATAAALAAVALYLVFTLPPRAIALDGDIPDHVVFGAYHVHSSRSDGTDPVASIAAAARAAGLSFVVVTDHGDGTRAPDRPAYVDDVLVIDAVEIGTAGGHLVALGLRGASPYPLGGPAGDVLEDVHRLGGAAIVAHPDSPEPTQRWPRGGGRGGAAGSQAYDGLEWLNADSQWRDEGSLPLVAAGLRSLFRPAESVVTVFSRPEQTLQRWDQATRTRAVVGLAAADAHGGISVERGAGGEARRTTLLRIPSYGAMFRAMAQAVVLDGPLTGEALVDAARVEDALRAGATFSVIRALAEPATVEFTAAGPDGVEVSMGGRLDAGRVSFRASVPQAPGVTLELWHQGRALAAGQGRLEHTAEAALGAYRVEVRFPGADVPWIVSNPIYVRAPLAAGRPESAAPAPPAGEVVPLPADDRWVIERDPTSTGLVTLDDGDILFDVELGGGPPSGQYVALVAPVQGNAGYDRIQFTISAESPMRVSLQLRLPGGRDGLRWRRSVYVGTAPRDVVVRLEDLEPVGGTTSQQPVVARIQSVLFVVDTVNTLPGTAGRLRISNVGLGLGNVEG